MDQFTDKTTKNILDVNGLNEMFNIQDSKLPIQTTTIDPNNTKQIYEEMGKLVQTGNYILETLKFHVEHNLDNAELVTGVANVMNSIRDTLKEFTKIYLNQIQHEQKIELEKLKLTGKKELLETKIQAANNILNSGENSKQLNDKQSIPLIPFSPENIIKEIIKAEKFNDR